MLITVFYHALLPALLQQNSFAVRHKFFRLIQSTASAGRIKERNRIGLGPLSANQAACLPP